MQVHSIEPTELLLCCTVVVKASVQINVVNICIYKYSICFRLECFASADMDQ